MNPPETEPGKASQEDDLDLIEEDDEALEADTSEEATKEAELTEGKQEPRDDTVEFEDDESEVEP
ncbi:MAG TPA: hypothetical protein VGL18_10690 [Actinomycetota bacterium]